MDNRAVDVLIVGAGPTGLVLALWLTRLGVAVRIIDKVAEPGTTSRALAVQARTLEFYRQIGIADAVLARGRQVGGAHLWVTGRQVGYLKLGDVGGGISPYAFAFIFPQDEHERLLIECLRDRGVVVEREVSLVGFELRSDRVIAQLQHANGRTESCEAAFIAGCDGAHSRVRETLNIGFGGGTYEHLFYVADVEARGAVTNGDIHVGLDRTDFLAVFPLKDPQRVRLVGTVRDDAAQRTGLTWNDVGRHVIEWMRVDVTLVNWFSTYRVHHRVADRFRHGRAFLLGDAAHIHSPVGGQGMNTGIGDAVNLAWKLAAVVRGRAAPAILDTFEPERIAFARRLVTTTDQAFTGVTSSSALARAVRLHIAPRVLPPLFELQAVRRFAFRTVSQTVITYRGSSQLSVGIAGGIHGGDRLPWVPLDHGSSIDNFAPLASLDWQLHVYGDASAATRAACEQRRLALHEFAWQPAMSRAGLRRDAMYLIRPDGYVGFSSGEQSVAELQAYLDAWAVK